MRWREWKNDDGDKRQAVDITADSVIPVPRNATAAAPEAAEAPEAEKAPAKRAAKKSAAKAGAAVGADEDIPF